MAHRLSVSVFAGAALAALLAAPACAEEPVAVPSGQSVLFVETIDEIADPGNRVLRFRFLAPGIGAGGGVDFDTASADMAWLCDAFVLPRLPEPAAGEALHIVVSLSDRPVPFGETDPEATQYFEAYRPENGACAWDDF